MEVDVYTANINKVTKKGFLTYKGWTVKVLDQRYGIAFYSFLTKPTAKQIRQCIKEWKRGLKPDNSKS